MDDVEIQALQAEENLLLRDKKGKRKIPWSMLYILATVVAIGLFGLLNNEFRNVLKIFSGLRPGYILGAVLVSLLYYVLEGEILRMLMRSQGIRMGFFAGLKIGFLGLYYSAITPGAAGGQPMQSAYLLRDKKVPAGESTAVLLIKFFAYQAAFSITALAAFFFMHDHLSKTVPAMIPLILLGLAINGGSVFFFGLLFYKPFFNAICRFSKWLICRFSFFKKHRRIFRAIDKFEKDFGSFTTDFQKKAGSVFAAILLSIPEFVLQMTMIYFVFLSFGYRSGEYPQILAVQSLLEVTVSFAPTPGASGAQELGFRELFGQYFTNNDLFTAMMVWRFFAFYLLVIAGGLLVVADQMWYKRKKKTAGRRMAAKAPPETLQNNGVCENVSGTK